MLSLKKKYQVSRHNKKDDLWVILNDNVYDLTHFQKIHPGYRLLYFTTCGCNLYKELFC